MAGLFDTFELPQFDMNEMIEGVARNQRIEAIKELPAHGNLWEYAAPQFAADGSISTKANYTLTKKGKIATAAGAGGLLLLFWMLSRG